MRWILCGKNEAAVTCLEFLVERGDEVLALAVSGDQGEDGWQRSFAKRARALGLRCEQLPRINAPESIAKLRDFEAQALISIQYDQILRAPLFDALDCPCLNLHFSLLPRHRGVAPIAWAVRCGDQEAGVSLHHMVVDIDAGDLIAQKRVPIGPRTTARELYDALSVAALELFRECHPFPSDLLADRLPQDATVASYHRAGELDFAERHVDWRRPASELERWIRSLIFPPLQLPETRLGERRLSITRVEMAQTESTGAAPGVVLARSLDALEVAAGDGTVRVLGLVDQAEHGLSATQLLRTIEVNERFS